MNKTANGSATLLDKGSDARSPTPAARPSICFVAHYAYGALTGRSGGHIGGVEWQTTLMARWFASQGYRVSVLTWDQEDKSDEIVHSVRIITMCRREAGYPGMRFFHPRWSSLNRALAQADADIYYHNCAEYVTGQIGMWCRRHGRAFVFSVASDGDVNPELAQLKKVRDRFFYSWGLRLAHRIIAQTQVQKQLLEAFFRRPSTVIPMPCQGVPEEAYVAPELGTRSKVRVLWIGRICTVKRPDVVLAVARACPELHFDIVGPADDSPEARHFMTSAAACPNIELHGGLQRDQVARLYDQAACLCCTSDVEGFPNTFLEAWSHGLPVVSRFDPDNLIVNHDLGVKADSIAELAAGIRSLVDAPLRWQQVSRNARQYYTQNHAVPTVLPRFESVFRDAISQARSGAHSSVSC